MTDRRIEVVELWFPRVKTNANTVVIQLSDVRAADDISVLYDYDRDGWVVQMDRGYWDNERWVVTEPSQELGFFPAWNEQTPEGLIDD